MNEKNLIGRTGFQYRPKERAHKIGFIMGLLNHNDPRLTIDYCVDEVYRALMIALDKAKEKADAQKDSSTPAAE